MENIVIWFSCGAASAVAAYKTIEKYGKENVTVVNNPVAEEDLDNRRFLKDVEKWLGIEIEICVNPKYPDCSAETIWKDQKWMGSISGANCTLQLKKIARYMYEMDHDIDWHVLGFVSEELKRFENFKKNERENTLPILIDAGISKADCYQIIHEAGLKLPEMYRLGFPNANCKGCIKATSPTYWNHTRVVFPEVFEARKKLSREIGAKLVRVKGKRIYLDELDPKAYGQPMKSLDFECGIFCHTNDQG
jgi:hypothetical protein